MLSKTAENIQSTTVKTMSEQQAPTTTATATTPGVGQEGDRPKKSLLSSGGKTIADEIDSQGNEIDPWNEPYYLKNGLRRVAPYFYTYKTFCKERWRGRGVYDIFSTEFRDRAPEYYVRFSLFYR